MLLLLLLLLFIVVLLLLLLLFIVDVFSAKKSIFTNFNKSDDNDLVVQCNHLQLGFTLPCAKAWAWDEVNTKNLVSSGSIVQYVYNMPFCNTLLH
jgi:hypothetical protein